jgi:hypothetical protein
MIRTIAIKQSEVFYKKVNYGFPSRQTIATFDLKRNGVYQITVVEGKGYKFRSGYCDVFYEVFLDGEFAFLVCKEAFDTIFFTPDCDKTYNITVKKVKK